MIGRAIKTPKWAKLGARITTFIFVAFVAEMVVIIILNQKSGMAVSIFLADMTTAIAGSVSRSWAWVYKMVGPMVFPLFCLTIIEICSVAKLFRHWKRNLGKAKIGPQYKALRIVEGVAPGFGFLGTCISLIITMHRMDPSLSQTAMLKVLLQNSSSAFGSTVYGISLAITSFIFLEIFQGFLIKEKLEERPEVESNLVQDDPASMTFIRKEA